MNQLRKARNLKSMVTVSKDQNTLGVKSAGSFGKSVTGSGREWKLVNGITIFKKEVFCPEFGM